MCTICAAFRPTDTTCIYTYFDQEKAAALPGQDVAYDVTEATGNGQATADEMEFAGTETVGNEGPDAANGQGTIYALDVTGAPQTFDGEIDFAGDRDWVQVTLTAGEYYAFEVSQRGSTPLNDSFLRLRDADGTIIKLNDDAGPGNQAAIFYQAEQTGTYYIDVGSYVNATNQSEFGTGSYRLTVSEFNPDMSIVSHDELADYLTDGFWSTRGGPWGVFDDTTTVITVDIDGLTADGQRLAKWAMQSYEMFLDIEFQIVSNGADIIFDDEVLNSAYASPVSSPTWPWGVDYIEVNVGRSWLSSYGTDVNDYTFQTYIHEIGHALGLGHQGDYNGSANFEVDFSSTANTNDFLNDFTLNSIMSYMDPNDNPFFGSSPASIVTPMLVDIIALQNIFGTPDATSTPTAGDTVWGKGHTFADAFAGEDIGTGSGSYLAALFDYAETGQDPNGWFDNSHVAFTIYDTSGHDLIDFSFDFTDQFVSLEAETLSTVFNPYLVGRNDNMWIARGTQIEDYYAGTGNDSITGNDVANVIKGNEGDDTIFGGGGNDSLEGGAGNDVIEGGLGDDLVEGSAGDDLLIDGSGNDTYFGGDGIDTLRFSADFDEFVFSLQDDGKVALERAGYKDVVDTSVEVIEFGDQTVDLAFLLDAAAETNNDFDLGLGVPETGSYGRGFNGTADADGIVSAGFTGTGEDLRLSFTAFDVDYVGEVEVFLNGASLGFVGTTANNGTDAFEFAISAADQQSGENVIEFRNENAAYMWGITDVLIEQGTVVDFDLGLGVAETGSYGRGFNGTADADGIVSAGFTGTGEDLRLSFTAFDVDYVGEVEVFLNGASLGFVGTTANNGTDAFEFAISAADQQSGENVIEFRNENAAYIWGITDVLIEQGTVVDFDLGLGVPETGSYGRGFNGTADADGIVSAGFTGTGEDLRLSFTAFDVDYVGEVEVFLNGASLGFVGTTANNGTDAFEFAISAADQQSGENVIEFRNENAAYMWGITDVLIEQGTVVDFDLGLGVAETGSYGRGFNGTADADGIVSAGFTGTGEDLRLSFTAFDVDYVGEVEVFLNGASLGFVGTTANNGTDAFEFAISAADQQSGENVIEFRNENAAYIWGITDVLIDDLAYI